MKPIILMIALLLFSYQSKAQFNADKYDSYDEYKSQNEKIKIYTVKINNKWGVVDSKGKELIPNEFDEIKDVYYGVTEIELLIHVDKGGFEGVLNLKNNFVVPLSNWIYIDRTGPFLYAAKKGPISSEYNTYNERMDTTYLFNQTGNLLVATVEHYEFKSFDIDTCITKDLYFTASKTNGKDYYDGYYDFFIIKPGQQPKKLFEYSRVELWPDKMFYVDKHPQVVSSERSSESKAFFSNIEGDLITTKGDYTNICCETMYPRYEAEEYGKFNEQRNQYEEGFKYIIDTSGNKLSEGYSSSTIISGNYYENDGFFYKIYNGSSITPLCPPPVPKSTIQNNSKITPNKTILPVKKEEPVVRINSFDDVIVSTRKYVNNDYLESYMDFNGKNITGWYDRILHLSGKYYDKVKNLVYNGGNLEVSRMEQDGGKLLNGIFSLVAKKEILAPKYNYIRLFEDGIYELKLNDKYGLWFQKDNILIEPIYDEIDQYPNRVKLNGVWGKIEKSVFVPF